MKAMQPEELLTGIRDSRVAAGSAERRGESGVSGKICVCSSFVPSMNS